MEEKKDNEAKFDEKLDSLDRARAEINDNYFIWMSHFSERAMALVFIVFPGLSFILKMVCGSFHPLIYSFLTQNGTIELGFFFFYCNFVGLYMFYLFVVFSLAQILVKK